jgi:hypothetical protein
VFDHAIYVKSSFENIKLLKSMNLKLGRDFRSERGAAKAGRDTSLRLVFKDRTTAMMFKLRSDC